MTDNTKLSETVDLINNKLDKLIELTQNECKERIANNAALIAEMEQFATQLKLYYEIKPDNISVLENTPNVKNDGTTNIINHNISNTLPIKTKQPNISDFFKKQWISSEEFRTKYYTDAGLADFDKKKQTVKSYNSKTPEELESAKAICMWAAIKDDPKKYSEIKALKDKHIENNNLLVRTSTNNLNSE